jgi:hypothetical protein
MIPDDFYFSGAPNPAVYNETLFCMIGELLVKHGVKKPQRPASRRIRDHFIDEELPFMQQILGLLESGQPTEALAVRERMAKAVAEALEDEEIPDDIKAMLVTDIVGTEQEIVRRFASYN